MSATASDMTVFGQSLDDFLRFTGNKNSREKMILILVMGMTGSGKSTLIQHCTGKKVQIGHGLQSCTNDLAVHSFFHEGYHVHMMDTPGFDDTNRSDIDTLKTISTYLSASFANGVRISGIIYLHRISDNRLGGTGLRNLRMFKKLSGKSVWRNVVVGTTMWKADEYSLSEQREHELVSNVDFLGDLVTNGAKVFRIAEHGTGADEQKRSSLQVVSHLIQRTKMKPSIELKIQRELVVYGKSLDDTAAGKEILGDLHLFRVQLTGQLKTVRQDMQEALRARDIESTRQLQALEIDCTRKITDSERQQEELKTSLMQMHDAEVNRLQARLDDMESKQRNMLKRKQRELKDLEYSLKTMREQSAIDEARWRRQALEAAAAEENRLASEKRQRERDALNQSLRMVREQAVEDEARRRRKALDEAAAKKKRRADEEINKECEQSIVALRKEVDKEKKHLEDVTKAKGVMRANVVQGVANGATTAVTTVLVTAAIAGTMCVVS